MALASAAATVPEVTSFAYRGAWEIGNRRRTPPVLDLLESSSAGLWSDGESGGRPQIYGAVEHGVLSVDWPLLALEQGLILLFGGGALTWAVGRERRRAATG